MLGLRLGLRLGLGLGLGLIISTDSVMAQSKGCGWDLFYSNHAKIHSSTPSGLSSTPVCDPKLVESSASGVIFPFLLQITDIALAPLAVSPLTFRSEIKPSSPTAAFIPIASINGLVPNLGYSAGPYSNFSPSDDGVIYLGLQGEHVAISWNIDGIMSETHFRGISSNDFNADRSISLDFKIYHLETGTWVGFTARGGVGSGSSGGMYIPHKFGTLTHEAWLGYAPWPGLPNVRVAFCSVSQAPSEFNCPDPIATGENY